MEACEEKSEIKFLYPLEMPLRERVEMRRYAGSELVPGIMEMVPAIGQRNLAPPYSRMCRPAVLTRQTLRGTHISSIIKATPSRNPSRKLA